MGRQVYFSWFLDFEVKPFTQMHMGEWAFFIDIVGWLKQNQMESKNHIINTYILYICIQCLEETREGIVIFLVCLRLCIPIIGHYILELGWLFL